MTGVCCHFLLQCIFPIQVWNLCLLQVCCIDRQILYHLATEKALEGGRGSNNGRHCKQRAWEKHTMQRLISLRASLLETWKWKSLSHVWLFVSPWIVVHGILQARILEWVAFPFCRGSSQPRDQTQVSRMAGGFFTSWVTREAQECWNGWPIPSPVDLPDPGIKPGSPALQADFLPTKLSGKPCRCCQVPFILEG